MVTLGEYFGEMINKERELDGEFHSKMYGEIEFLVKQMGEEHVLFRNLNKFKNSRASDPLQYSTDIKSKMIDIIRFFSEDVIKKTYSYENSCKYYNDKYIELKNEIERERDNFKNPTLEDMLKYMRKVFVNRKNYATIINQIAMDEIEEFETKFDYIFKNMLIFSLSKLSSALIYKKTVKEYIISKTKNEFETVYNSVEKLHDFFQQDINYGNKEKKKPLYDPLQLPLGIIKTPITREKKGNPLTKRTIEANDIIKKIKEINNPGYSEGRVGAEIFKKLKKTTVKKLSFIKEEEEESIDSNNEEYIKKKGLELRNRIKKENEENEQEDDEHTISESDSKSDQDSEDSDSDSNNDHDNDGDGNNGNDGNCGDNDNNNDNDSNDGNDNDDNGNHGCDEGDVQDKSFYDYLPYETYGESYELQKGYYPSINDYINVIDNENCGLFKKIIFEDYMNEMKEKKEMVEKNVQKPKLLFKTTKPPDNNKELKETIINVVKDHKEKLKEIKKGDKRRKLLKIFLDTNKHEKCNQCNTNKGYIWQRTNKKENEKHHSLTSGCPTCTHLSATEDMSKIITAFFKNPCTTCGRYIRELKCKCMYIQNKPKSQCHLCQSWLIDLPNHIKYHCPGTFMERMSDQSYYCEVCSNWYAKKNSRHTCIKHESSRVNIDQCPECGDLLLPNVIHKCTQKMINRKKFRNPNKMRSLCKYCKKAFNDSHEYQHYISCKGFDLYLRITGVGSLIFHNKTIDYLKRMKGVENVRELTNLKCEKNPYNRIALFSVFNRIVPQEITNYIIKYSERNILTKRYKRRDQTFKPTRLQLINALTTRNPNLTQEERIEIKKQGMILGNKAFDTIRGRDEEYRICLNGDEKNLKDKVVSLVKILAKEFANLSNGLYDESNILSGYNEEYHTIKCHDFFHYFNNHQYVIRMFYNSFKTDPDQKEQMDRVRKIIFIKHVDYKDFHQFDINQIRKFYNYIYGDFFYDDLDKEEHLNKKYDINYYLKIFDIEFDLPPSEKKIIEEKIFKEELPELPNNETQQESTIPITQGQHLTVNSYIGIDSNIKNLYQNHIINNEIDIKLYQKPLQTPISKQMDIDYEETNSIITQSLNTNSTVYSGSMRSDFVKNKTQEMTNEETRINLFESGALDEIIH